MVTNSGLSRDHFVAGAGAADALTPSDNAAVAASSASDDKVIFMGYTPLRFRRTPAVPRQTREPGAGSSTGVSFLTSMSEAAMTLASACYGGIAWRSSRRWNP